MEDIGAFEAKTHFSEVLRRVSEGESFSITNRGRVVAILSPPVARKRIRNKAHADPSLTVFIEFGKKHPLGTLSELLEWKNKGRK